MTLIAVSRAGTRSKTAGVLAILALTIFVGYMSSRRFDRPPAPSVEHGTLDFAAQHPPAEEAARQGLALSRVDNAAPERPGGIRDCLLPQGVPQERLAWLSTRTTPPFMLAAYPFHHDPGVVGPLQLSGVFDDHVLAGIESVLAPGGLNICHEETHPPPVFVDAGANLGFMGLYAAALGCVTYAIEAQPSLLPYLRASGCVNGFKHYHPLNIGISVESGTMAIPKGPGNQQPRGVGADAVKGCGSECDQVATMRLDAIISQAVGNRPVKLLKMDLEGYENQALESLEGVHAQIENLITEFNPKSLDKNGQALGKPNTAVALLQWLHVHGFLVYELEIDQQTPWRRNYQVEYAGNKVFSKHFESSYAFPVPLQMDHLGQRHVKMTRVHLDDLSTTTNYVEKVRRGQSGSRRDAVDLLATRAH